jgi:hypothetical protein
VPIVIAIAAVFATAAAWQMGMAAGHALWLWAVLAVILAGLACLWAWHRRQLAQIHELYAVELGRWNRQGWHAPWPKWCQDCGLPVHGWDAARAHDDPDTSPCARYLAHRMELDRAEVEALPNTGWTADILGPRPGEPRAAVATEAIEE